MRTVTFADADLSADINAAAVPVWHNQDAGNELNTSGKMVTFGSQATPAPQTIKAYPVGAGGMNMITYFLSPRGRLVHYLEGYWPPQHFRQELEFAQRQMQQSPNLEPQERTPLIKAKLTQRISLIQQQQQALQREHPGEFRRPVAESKIYQQFAVLQLKANAYANGANYIGLPIRKMLEQAAQARLMRGAMI